jgi:uncharacterized protein YbjQ (UPF0145 family)
MAGSAEFLTTTETMLMDHHVVERFGVVRGIAVRSRSAVGLFGAKIQQFFGGDISLMRELCERTRSEAFSDLIDHARALGANALVGVRYDATEIMPGVSEVICYGTAMRVVKRKDAAA